MFGLLTRIWRKRPTAGIATTADGGNGFRGIRENARLESSLTLVRTKVERHGVAKVPSIAPKLADSGANPSSVAAWLNEHGQQIAVMTGTTFVRGRGRRASRWIGKKAGA